ncbi:superinfection immunity protein [Mesorhizobium sp. B3-1-3]|uniref:superinfection immunity protein n=1 Tax=unclassified Mesorhizobium TaxID=325217 RepID=UPI0011272C22|nr:MULTISPECIES: superinfection immunity protein [unclassified Mesorhizobium]TPI65555.1 superinfection immunity protein [Mesorhizobium sp. B3-1-8]TPI72750.1 superinfection immunity protein [Mesorhizobium sp. B3-1-3]
MSDPQSEFLTVLLIATIIFLIPSIIAFLRRHPNRWMIFLLNTFLGATGIVWFGCLIWACKAIHITANPKGTNGGESGLNLAANDIRRVRLENAPAPRPLASRPPGEDMLNRLERLKKLRDDGAIDAEQFQRMRDGIVGTG